MERLRFRPYFTASPENGTSMKRERAHNCKGAEHARAEGEWARKKGGTWAEGSNVNGEEKETAL